jgi:hypothetical protein
MIFRNLHAATSSLSSYLTVLTLSSYNPLGCAKACTDNKDCVSYNLYLERSPSSPPTTPSNPNPAPQTLVRCALYSSLLSPSTATNTGQYQESFQIAIAGSNGYTNSLAKIVPEGFAAPEPFGSKAIDAPGNCRRSYLGLRTFSMEQQQQEEEEAQEETKGMPARKCAEACDAMNSHNNNNNNNNVHSNSNNSNNSSSAAASSSQQQHQRRHHTLQSRQTPSAPPSNSTSPSLSAPSQEKRRECSFFNSYMLYNNSLSTGIWQCALFADVWEGEQATNRGQFRGSDKISVGESWGYRRVTTGREAGVASCSA